MNISAKQILLWIQASIKALAADPRYGTLESVYDRLSALSGVSRSSIVKVASGISDNPTTKTLDALAAAIKSMQRAAA